MLVSFKYYVDTSISRYLQLFLSLSTTGCYWSLSYTYIFLLVSDYISVEQHKAIQSIIVYRVNTTSMYLDLNFAYDSVKYDANG